MSIELDKPTRATLEASIIKYCERQLDYDLGNLDAAFLLDYVLAEIGPCVYNQAVKDVQNNLLRRVNEVDTEVFADEFTYWSTQKR